MMAWALVVAGVIMMLASLGRFVARRRKARQVASGDGSTGAADDLAQMIEALRSDIAGQRKQVERVAKTVQCFEQRDALAASILAHLQLDTRLTDLAEPMRDLLAEVAATLSSDPVAWRDALKPMLDPIRETLDELRRHLDVLAQRDELARSIREYLDVHGKLGTEVVPGLESIQDAVSKLSAVVHVAGSNRDVDAGTRPSVAAHRAVEREESGP